MPHLLVFPPSPIVKDIVRIVNEEFALLLLVLLVTFWFILGLVLTLLIHCGHSSFAIIRDISGIVLGSSIAYTGGLRRTKNKQQRPRKCLKKNAQWWNSHRLHARIVRKRSRLPVQLTCGEIWNFVRPIAEILENLPQTPLKKLVGLEGFAIHLCVFL